MAVKSTDTKSTAGTATADKPAADVDATATDTAPSPRVESDCVVKLPFHVGRAVNGKVCSYHAMHYAADGSRR